MFLLATFSAAIGLVCSCSLLKITHNYQTKMRWATIAMMAWAASSLFWSMAYYSILE